MTGQKVSVGLPAFREEKAIGSVIKTVRSVMGSGCEIIVVDDGSPDGTGKEAEKAGARVVRHPYNMGNGAAVKSGIRAATGDVIVLMDSDGKQKPEDIPRFLEKVGAYDMVMGARTRASETSVHRVAANARDNK